jgi:enoyl-CoA hydratase
MSDAPHLLTEEKDGILIATLNRPDKLNVLSRQLMDLLEAGLHHFRDTPTLKVMLIRSTGRYFCAGADLRSPDPKPFPDTASGIRERHRLGLNGMHRIYDEMEAIEKPIVAAHHATCVGGGLEMSMSCDFRLAAKSASYAFPESKMGVLPASNGVSRLTRLCGTHWARWLVMADMVASADLALTMGLVHQVFPDETFEEEVMRFCRHLTGRNGEHMAAAKIAIEMAADLGAAQARNVERMANAGLMLNADYRETLTKYVKSVGSEGKK